MSTMFSKGKLYFPFVRLTLTRMFRNQTNTALVKWKQKANIFVNFQWFVGTFKRVRSLVHGTLRKIAGSRFSVKYVIDFSFFYRQHRYNMNFLPAFIQLPTLQTVGSEGKNVRRIRKYSRLTFRRVSIVFWKFTVFPFWNNQLFVFAFSKFDSVERNT